MRRGAPPLRLLRLANPVVRAVLASPAHRLLSGRLLVLGYRGRRSGKTFRIPLLYAVTKDARLVSLAVGAERKLWWRAFGEPTAATLILRGRTVDVVGAVASGAARDVALAAYLERHPRSARVTQDAAVVVFTER